jgi:hypothetical protein
MSIEQVNEAIRVATQPGSFLGERIGKYELGNLIRAANADSQVTPEEAEAIVAQWDHFTGGAKTEYVSRMEYTPYLVPAPGLAPTSGQMQRARFAVQLETLKAQDPSGAFGEKISRAELQHIIDVAISGEIIEDWDARMDLSEAYPFMHRDAKALYNQLYDRGVLLAPSTT